MPRCTWTTSRWRNLCLRKRRPRSCWIIIISSIAFPAEWLRPWAHPRFCAGTPGRSGLNCGISSLLPAAGPIGWDWSWARALCLREAQRVLGRNAVVDVSAADPSGLRSFKVTLSQGGQDTVLVEDTYDPPRPQAAFHWTPAQEKKLRLQPGATVD